MARVTVEDSLKVARNRFALVLLAASRVKQIFKGSKVLSTKKGNREVVTALREIAETKVGYARPELLARMGKKEEPADTPIIDENTVDESAVDENK